MRWGTAAAFSMTTRMSRLSIAGTPLSGCWGRRPAAYRSSAASRHTRIRRLARTGHRNGGARGAPSQAGWYARAAALDLPRPVVAAVDRAAGKYPDAGHEFHMAGAAAGQEFEITVLAAEQDQRGGIARPHDGRLSRMACPHRFGNVIHGAREIASLRSQ